MSSLTGVSEGVVGRAGDLRRPGVGDGVVNGPEGPAQYGEGSADVPEQGLMAISPSGIGYFDTRPEDVVVTDLEANIVD